MPTSKTLVLSSVRKMAKARNGVCLSKIYVNSPTKLSFKCQKGHTWKAVPHSIINGTWCKICGFESGRLKRSDSIQTFKQIAEERQGKCLSSHYHNQVSKLKFRCSKEHVFFMRAAVIKRGGWCNTCQREKHLESITSKYSKKVVEQLKRICNKKKGKIVSGRYINGRSKFVFECSKKHQWETLSHLVIKGHWCKECAIETNSAKQRDSLDKFVSIIEKKGGKCLSKNYINQQSKLHVECKHGHRWWSLAMNIRAGYWCRKCYGTAKSDIQEMIRIASERGGVCLSTEYISDATKIKWKCSEEHIWEATPNNIKHDKWCPTCSQGLGERICRLFFEKIFGNSFIKVRPEWLVSPAGYSLELDGYCQDLNIAFEHQGRQHYSDISFFSNRKNYDKHKRLLCKQRGVTLIEIPEVLTDTKISDLKNVIIQECRKKKFPVPRSTKNIVLTPFEIFTYTKNQERKRLVEKAELLIDSKGGKLYETNLTKNGLLHKIRCRNDHNLTITNLNLFRGHWCKKCS